MPGSEEGSLYKVALKIFREFLFDQNYEEMIYKAFFIEIQKVITTWL